MFEPIEATWTFSREELEGHWAAISRRIGVHRKQASHGVVVLMAVIVFCVAAAVLAPTAGLLVGFMCFVVVMLFWTLVYWLSKSGDVRVARQWARTIIAAGPEGVEITQTHLHFRNDGIDSRVRWSHVADVGSTSTSLTVWLNDFQAVLLPTRIFSTADIQHILALWTAEKLSRRDGDVPGWLVRGKNPPPSV